MKNNYVIWTTQNVGGACILDEIKGFEKIIKLKRGETQFDNFPDNVEFLMDFQYPNDTILVDNIGNYSMLIVISLKLKLFLESQNVTNTEYLPISILNHKGKLASSDYFILNPINPIDCIDMEKSEAKLDPLRKIEIRRVKQLVLDNSKIDIKRSLFKPKSFYRTTFIKRELAEAIDKASFTGVRWLEIDKYPEI